MLRKAGHIILGVIIMVVTMGVTINKHYSGGNLYSISLFFEAESCCEKDCDCCSDESQTYKIDDNFLVTNISQPEIPSMQLLASKKQLINTVLPSLFETQNKDFYNRLLPITHRLQPVLQTFLI
jgi:dihydroorotate dehydrogenase